MNDMHDPEGVSGAAAVAEVGTVILGIDPGAGGALAWVTNDGHLIEVADMPVIEVRGKRRISAAGVRHLMTRRPIDRAVIEGVGAMPGNGGVSMFNFGYGAGLLEGVAAGLAIPVEMIRPAVWKRLAGVPADKGAAREMATRLWPGATNRFQRVRDDGRAEAALLARWAGAK